MTTDTFRHFVRRQPFEPFVVHLSDGRALEVNHPDFVLLPPNWRSSEIIVALSDGSWEFVYLGSVTSVKSSGAPMAFPARKAGTEDDSGS